MHMAFSMKVTPEIEELTNICLDNSKMDVSLYGQYDVKRGLRDINGVGVLAGLTQISNVVSSDIIDGVKTPCDGRLYYRGINVEKLTQGFLSENRMGFEEVAYLLLFGNLPNEEQLNHFKTILKQQQSLPKNFVRDVVMKAPTKDMMNTLSRSVLTLYAYDNHADDTSLPNVLRQCINLISVFPMLSVYGYQAYNHYIKGKSLYIHNPSKKLSTAENILLMLRPDQKYTPLEAKILDLALVLHMEHGGGNNSTFTTHVVSSSGTDTYSAIAAALGSLKGPKHGGANIKVVRMFDDMKSHVKDWTDEEEVSNYLRKLLHKEAFDQKGLIVIDKEEVEMDEEELMMAALDAGAEDFAAEEDSYEITTSPDDFSAVREALEAAGIPMASAEVTMIPQTYVELTDAKDIANIQKTLDMLDDDDDVQDVYHNWDE